MLLAHKSNEEIENEIIAIVRKERSLGVEGVLYFCEVVKRRMHLAGKHSSLFSYLIGKGYTRDQALVRKDAVLLLVELPTLVHYFVNAAFTLSSLHYIRQIFRREQRRRRKEKLPELTQERKFEVVRKLLRESTRDTRRMLAEEFPECHLSTERTRPVAGNKTEITFSCTEDELKVYEELKDMWGHKNYERSWQVFFADLGFDALKREKAARAKTIDEEKVGTPEKMSYQKARRRYRSVHVDRLVRNLAGDRCEHRDPVTDERCECTHALQIDHIVALALGGVDHPENMRLLCGSHNRYAAWKQGQHRPDSKEIYN
jgi:hypothetical protein